VEALYGKGGLPFWTEPEILIRDQAIATLRLAVESTLTALNSAWNFHRIEGPLLTPRSFISPAYDESDIFTLKGKLGDDDAALRAETTASSYLFMDALMKRTRARLPICILQAGKSFRQEAADGASPSKLRFNEFYQLEFQCAYKEGTMADYRAAVEPAVAAAIKRITGARETRIVDSDRLPAYSLVTRDIEVPFVFENSPERWTEMCSISTRNDYPGEGVVVLEIAIGLDRLVSVAMSNA
jgi:glycyl-tRNA synthetase